MKNKGFHVHLWDKENGYDFYDEVNGEPVVYKTMEEAEQRRAYLFELDRWDNITIYNITTNEEIL